MLRFIAVRMAALVAVVLLVATVTWVILHALRAEDFAFDQRPVLTQYATYMERAFLHGDFGTQWTGSGRPVMDLMKESVPQDVILLFGSMAIALLFGMTGGAYCAARRGRPAARVLETLASFMVVAPPYVLGLSLLLLFGSGIAILEVGFGIPTQQVPMNESLGGWFGSMIVPWIILSLPFGAFCLRMMSGSMKEVLDEQYLRTAKAKGLHERTILRRHAAPAAAAPVFSLLGASVPLLVTNMVIIEHVFSIPGFFQDLAEFMDRGDFPVIQGMAVVIAVLVTVSTMIVDAALAYLDPVARGGGTRTH